jgi:hypothetical protein
MTTDPAQLIAYITTAQAQAKALAADIDAWKAELQALYASGAIPDKLSTPFGSAALTTRSTWTYSPAVKQLQELEQLEGVATKKTSSSWTIRPAADEQPDF